MYKVLWTQTTNPVLDSDLWLVLRISIVHF
jgi:hypothetical protein